MIDRRVRTQARGQNNRSKALKWGIVHLCTSNDFGDTTKCMKIWVFQFNYFAKSQKLKNIRKLILFVLIISLKLLQLQRHKMPHFKALDLLFWPLA